MKVLIVGVGDAFTRLHFGSSALIEAPEGYVLLDCPDLVHRALHDATAAAKWDVKAPQISDIILTHLHGDHCNGLESFGFFRRLRCGSNPTRPRLHASEPVAARVWERLAPAMDGAIGRDGRSTLADYYDVHLLSPDREATVAGLRIGCRFTGHPVPTVGLRITDGSSTLGWSGDTPFDAEHVRWLSDADTIVHESNVSVAHTPIECLNELPAALRSKIRLIHLPDDFDAACTDMIPLREGEVLEI